MEVAVAVAEFKEGCEFGGTLFCVAWEKEVGCKERNSPQRFCGPQSTMDSLQDGNAAECS